MQSSVRALSGVQNVVPGCPQPPMAQHCPRIGEVGLVHVNVHGPMASSASLCSDDVPPSSQGTSIGKAKGTNSGSWELLCCSLAAMWPSQMHKTLPGFCKCQKMFNTNLQ